ncbi:hypothetical protein G7B40_026320 [Aetokthonos hydrillicola Thurmond2011]|jgi:hypothetical protein|uniref:Uncharacterized protein n=1 Tax=Aetokthonos hydrillicola Thurmond2011 TaxID=2712845 RepID=A0AAP5IBC1_9CYAN|nr:hypothetical protein [Aetokthonos hydrillicola]MBO3460332.1 hypothetical protein [Aetokthonos hydrillicola CCALA 1050]MBW4590786.1 hypothetical protein [Aetokthonos hydrillicola CCALA 1050]MDR9898049.1 hypothetical protein [Aetokthonos hydrillicola Thurmond2011]
MNNPKKEETYWKPEGEQALDRSPVCFKVSTELKNELRSIPDWQKKLRASLPRLISEWKDLHDGG